MAGEEGKHGKGLSMNKKLVYTPFKAGRLKELYRNNTYLSRCEFSMAKVHVALELGQVPLGGWLEVGTLSFSSGCLGKEHTN